MRVGKTLALLALAPSLHGCFLFSSVGREHGRLAYADSEWRDYSEGQQKKHNTCERPALVFVASAEDSPNLTERGRRQAAVEKLFAYSHARESARQWCSDPAIRRYGVRFRGRYTPLTPTPDDDDMDRDLGHIFAVSVPADSYWEDHPDFTCRTRFRYVHGSPPRMVPNGKTCTYSGTATALVEPFGSEELLAVDPLRHRRIVVEGDVSDPLDQLSRR